MRVRVWPDYITTNQYFLDYVVDYKIEGENKGSHPNKTPPTHWSTNILHLYHNIIVIARCRHHHNCHRSHRRCHFHYRCRHHTHTQTRTLVVCTTHGSHFRRPAPRIARRTYRDIHFSRNRRCRVGVATLVTHCTLSHTRWPDTRVGLLKRCHTGSLHAHTHQSLKPRHGLCRTLCSLDIDWSLITLYADRIKLVHPHGLTHQVKSHHTLTHSSSCNVR